MSATSEQIQAVEDQFFAAVPAALAYKTDENLDRMYAYIQSAFPESILSVAAWEIAFKSCKLKKIAGWVEPVTDEQRQLVDSTPGYIARQKYKTDPEFREAFDLVANEEKERQELLKWARTYQAMDPTEAAQRSLDEPGFKEAVQTLIDEGLI